MSRIPVITESSELTSAQRRVVDGILGRRGGRIPGPYRLSLHCPEVTEAWHPLGEALRLKSTFPLRLSEFTMIVAARAMDCDYVFNAHAPAAIKAGLSESIVDALVRDERPRFANADEEAIYDYCMQLHRHHAVSDAAHARARELFGIPGVVELTALFGYYVMVAMTLLAHEMPLQQDAKYRLLRRA
ncbi:MAG: carboxymuconolactone decarboxylase family protein [Burkholderiales bacterium]|nr:carboxymuconolactone decarboxylase family protein [Burkholderiales bacterium]